MSELHRFLDEARALLPAAVALRRRIHQKPELGLDLPLTTQAVLDELQGLDVAIARGPSTSGLIVTLNGAKPGRTILLRGDMDALPVTERTGLPFASQIDGTMHACGHDLHTAMLAGAARLLSARRGELPGSVIFMFQPGEEGHAGARVMIEEGVLDAAGGRPVAAYGLHVASAQLPGGVLSTRPGTIMAAADTFEVTVHGRGGHASQPHNAADPIPAACEIVTALQTMVTRKFNVFDPVVLTVGSFHAGTVDNVIPDDARMAASLRTFSPETRARAMDAAIALVHDVAAAHGLTATAEFGQGYPVTVNDAGQAEFAQSVVTGLLGTGRFVPTPYPLTGSEDFSYVLEEVPGAFLMLGACLPGSDPATAAFNHSPEAAFDDAVLADGAAVYAALAIKRLAAG